MKHLFNFCRQGKRITAALTVLLLTASQLAVAMHACSSIHMSSAASHMSVDNARDRDCSGDSAGDTARDTSGNAALCKQHCENGHQNFAKPLVADQISVVAVFSIPSIIGIETGHSAAPLAVDRVASNPPFLRNANLRI